jgi:hypothetical protein
MLKAMAQALNKRPSFRTTVLPLAISLVAQVEALIVPMNAQAAGNSFAIATRYGEIVCTSQLAEDRKGLDVTCVAKNGQVVSAYRQAPNGTITVLLEEGKAGQAVTKAILDSQGKG